MSIAGLLLAAGGGSRYGIPKALAAPYGEPLVHRGVRALREAGLAPVVVVVGAAGEQVRALLNAAVIDAGAGGSGTSVIVADNPAWETGMGSSLRAGLRALEPLDVDAALILLVDMPGITAAAIARVASAATSPSALVAASYGGSQGHPVLIGREHWAGVAALADGDVGARPYLRAHVADLHLVACDDVADGTDLDTPPAGSTP